MKKPNIVFFFTDDQRFNTIRAINNPEIHTPTMDLLARQGTFFSQAFIPGGTCPAVCMPSRAMVHTGRSLFSIQGNGETIPKDHTIMGEYFRKSGYETFGTGKWHNGPASYARSFSAGGEIFFGGMDDHWNVPVCNFKEDGNYPEPVPHPWNGGTGTVENIPKSYDHVIKGTHSTDIFCDKTIEFLQGRQGSEPFFVYLAFMAPHDPRTMPVKFQTMYDPGKISLPLNFIQSHPFDNGELDVRDEKLAASPRKVQEIQRHLAEYYGMISHLDEGMGRVLDALKASGEYENTIIILAGDNGLALGSHGLMGKQNLYDHSIHIPLLICGPGIVQNQINPAFCYLYDLFPTLCELAGMDIPATVEGKSLVRALRGKTDSHRERMFFAYREIQRAIQKDNKKLILYLVNSTLRVQLFNLLIDPLELNNLADVEGEQVIIKQLFSELEEEMKRNSDPVYSVWKKYMNRFLSAV